MKTRLSIIGTVGLPANYGGFETLAEHLVTNLSVEYAIDVYCSGKKYAADARKKTYKGANLFYLPFDANGVQSIIYDSISILHALFRSDVLLVLGVAGAWLLPFVKLFTNKKIIISIDGIEWKRDKWNVLAKWYLFWAEGLAVKYSHIDISDNEAIQDYTASRYGSLSRIIEYGADHVLNVKVQESDLNTYPFLSSDYAVKVCRIEPENNVHNVLEAFSRVKSQKLVIIGNWENSDYGKNLKSTYSGLENITILDPIYDQEKLDLIRGNASLYVHGHSAGGTNPSLVEAMYLGLPIIAFGVSYNRVTTEEKALYFNSLGELVDQLQGIDDGYLKPLGAKMLEVGKRRYNWKLISQKYRQLVLEALSAPKKKSILSKSNKLDKDVLSKLELNHILNQETFYSKR
ncbi:Glycosyltransferase involved in cell wall bisynthesis [Marivirga sericea]|uniref:Glycosyltransferase involved in cell wall bisynthesis n=1 Tax=Marivirga sericea TaxID=1028 RepID=A0A1X7IB05_9BACT|nr:DUF1972 domain-containing protein [Marivirga sericea]SMG11343.1 Glycosyltransferase involved in cell wall bisynthesis [Marivirga sericea]